MSNCNKCGEEIRIIVNNNNPTIMNNSCGCGSNPYVGSRDIQYVNSSSNCYPCSPECTDMVNTSCLIFNGEDISCLTTPILQSTGLNDVLLSLATQVCDLQTFSSWTEVTLESPWVFNFEHASYRKIGDIVYLRGSALQNSYTDQLIAILPLGFRPAISIYIPVYILGDGTGSVTAIIKINIIGEITIHFTTAINTDNINIFLDGINFSISL